MNLPLVVVTWNDAWEASSPVTIEDVMAHHAPTVVTTIGWLLYQDAMGVSLANEYYESTFRGRSFIYGPMIIKVERFTLSKPRAKRAAKAVEEPQS